MPDGRAPVSRESLHKKGSSEAMRIPHQRPKRLNDWNRLAKRRWQNEAPEGTEPEHVSRDASDSRSGPATGFACVASSSTQRRSRSEPLSGAGQRLKRLMVPIYRSQAPTQSTSHSPIYPYAESLQSLTGLEHPLRPVVLSRQSRATDRASRHCLPVAAAGRALRESTHARIHASDSSDSPAELPRPV